MSKAANSAIQNARALHGQGQHRQAEDIYRLVLLQEPENGAALLDLGLLLAQRGETEEPLALYKKVLELEPKNSNVMVALAIVTLENGDRAEALQLAAHARDMKPAPQALARLGMFYGRAGLRDDAVQCLSAAIARAPDEVSSYFNLQRVKKINRADAEFRNLLALEKKQASLNTHDRSTLHFTLANVYLDASETDNAFRHYAEANRLKKSATHFDAAQFTRQIDTLIAQFTPEFVKQLAGGGNDNERPIFIIGLPRSGSTLVEQIIASHPQARGLGEVKFLPESLPVQMHDLTPQILKDIAARYLAATDKYAAGRERLADKMLSNFLWAGIIRLALPKAKIIHCTRDPADNAFSIWQVMFSEGLVPWAYDTNDIGCYFRGYRKLMAHWEKLFPHEIYEANYEALVRNQEQESKKLVEFCGLPWDARCLKFNETERTVKTASAAQVRRPLYADSVHKWKKYENYLAPLLQAIEKP